MSERSTPNGRRRSNFLRSAISTLTNSLLSLESSSSSNRQAQNQTGAVNNNSISISRNESSTSSLSSSSEDVRRISFSLSSVRVDEKEENEQKRYKFDLTEFKIMQLPYEIQLLVASFLDACDLSKLSRSNKYFHELCQSNSIWKEIAERRFQFSSHLKIDWKEYYFQRFMLSTKDSFKWEAKTLGKGDKPKPRIGHQGIAVDSKTIVYIGGYDDTLPKRFNDIYFFDTETCIMKKVENRDVPRFARHTSVLINGIIYSFGGYDGEGTFFGLATYNPKTNEWNKNPIVRGIAPIPRTNHAATAVGNKMYVYGGNRDHEGKYLTFADLFCLDTETMTWIDLSPKMKGELPKEAIAHRLIGMEYNNRLYLLGGGLWFPGEEYWRQKFGHVYEFNLETFVWRKIKCEEMQTCTFSVSAPLSWFIFVFGGQKMNGDEVSKKTQVFDTVSESWIPCNPVGEILERDMSAMNVVKDRIVVFAGSWGQAIQDISYLEHPIFGRLTTQSNKTTWPLQIPSPPTF